MINKKGKLKGKKIRLGDDLTKYRANLAFLAHKAVKKGKAESTWINDSRVFLKVKDENSPRKIATPNDIPK